jgi:ABC-type nickel/cobalt efflux system permease component RcnA
MSLGVVLGFGLLLGMQHATEADHLAAVASLASRERSLEAGIFHGIAWGIGHALMLLVVAGAIGFLGWAISPLMAGNMERVVGAMLILLGIGVLRRLWRERIHFHVHTHTRHANVLAPQTQITHFHAHSHAGELQPHWLSAHAHSHKLPWRSLLVGMVHGLAGSAALALLASQSMPSPGWMLVYIAIFGIGSILGMALLSGILAIPLGLTARHLTGVYRALNDVVALFSLALGGRLLFGLGG